MNKRGGFSMMEILVSMVLLGAVGAVTISAFTSSVRVTGNDTGVAFNVGRGEMEKFFEFVRQDQWADTGRKLSVASAPARPAIADRALNTETYATTYTVNDMDNNGNDDNAIIDANGDGQEDYRKVKMTVTW